MTCLLIQEQELKNSSQNNFAILFIWFIFGLVFVFVFFKTYYSVSIIFSANH